MDQSRSTKTYFERFSSPPEVASFAPGRVELLGNHTDYNGGAVLTVAIHQGVRVLGRATDDLRCTIHSHTMQETISFARTDSTKSDSAWGNYPKGVVHELNAMGIRFGGFEALIDADLPIGAGVSSSAALELATLLMIKQLYPFDMERMDWAHLCRKAENDFVGMPCGLLDQFSSAFGKKDHALLLDCTSLAHEAIGFASPAPALVLCQSGVKHALVEGEYKQRRDQCIEACRLLAEAEQKPYALLCEVPLDVFERHEASLPELPRKRAHHVLHEHARVLQGAQALNENRIDSLGALMLDSHGSSRDWFENSCPELDRLVEFATTFDGCFGAKLTGGGFGGATVNLVEATCVEPFVAEMKARYADAFGHPCETMVCRIGDGAFAQAIEPY